MDGEMNKGVSDRNEKKKLEIDKKKRKQELKVRKIDKKQELKVRNDLEEKQIGGSRREKENKWNKWMKDEHGN